MSLVLKSQLFPFESLVRDRETPSSQRPNFAAMKIRASRISSSIARAISRAYHPRHSASIDLLGSISAFFAFFRLLLTRYRPADFLALRHDSWRLDEEAYLDSFQDPRASGKAREVEAELVPVGDLGYSGSTFFVTPNGKFLVKSLPRAFEHEFFAQDLFDAYVARVRARPESLLVRITDMVHAPYPTLGGLLGMAPTHHIIMENLLYGKDSESEELRAKWETYDLKPDTYFFPERDIADGALAPDSVIDKLVDEFPGKAVVRAEQKALLMDILGEDTRVLAENGAVDYSLFLVRFPGPRAGDEDRSVPSLTPHGGPWRTGVDDVEGRWKYRVVVLDFFWAKHKLRAMAMTGLIDAFNLFARKGPMSITAEPGEYRERFIGMVDQTFIGRA